MRFSHKKQKLFLTLFILSEFFVTSAFPVSAGFFGGPSIPSASSIMSDMEQRYHLDPTALQNQGEMMNVSGTKGSAPEVSISFSPSDPKPGEKLSAKAFPIYFSNEEKALYYTWYLKRAGCDLKNNVGADPCDVNNDNKITVEDWKIEAGKILVQNGYDNAAADYSKDTDDDGYKARYGGDNKTNVTNRCYINDASTGINYEFVNNLPTDASGCSSGTPVCVVEQQGVSSGSLTLGSGDVFSSGGTGNYFVSGFPTCSSSALTCSIGTASCSSTSLVPPDSTCATVSRLTAGPYCRHLFPDAPSKTSGDGSFSANEEQFWGTNPSDPSTADNGNKDEANVIGLGQSSFTWNYDKGDQVGVAVEGTSMFPTKFGDSSFMIMWAFPKKNCPVLDLATKGGSYVENVKGYDVKIDAVEGLDLNDCIAYIKNGKEHDMSLVDPTEGGQATKLSVSVSATPDNPINDASDNESGDTVTAQATVDNAAQSSANILFDWKVYIGGSIASFNSATTSKDITSELRDLKLLGNTKGNGLDSISLKLDIKNPDIPPSLLSYLTGGMGYLRFKVATQESFDGGGTRKGNNDDGVIVKFISSNDSITAYSVVAGPADGTTKVSLNSSLNPKICNGSSTPEERLDRTMCRVIKNEIIGLKIDDTGLSNFNWTINGAPLVCTARVSGVCAKGGSGTVDAEAQGDTNFFPVSGNPGDTYTVTMTANEVASGKTVTLTRSFNVVEPKVVIESNDKTIAWPKFLGRYKDLTGASTCSGSNGYCDDLSESVYQSYFGSTLNFKAVFIPPFLGGASWTTQKEWTLDGEPIGESNPNMIQFSAGKPAPEIYNINLLAQVVQPENIRKALLDIWGITGFDSPEINFASSVQVEVQEPLLTEGPLSGPRKYYAAIASYIPASILFTFRIFLSVVLTLFALSFLNALLEERRIKAFTENFSRKQ